MGHKHFWLLVIAGIVFPLCAQGLAGEEAGAADGAKAANEGGENRESGFLGEPGAIPSQWAKANWAEKSDFSKSGIAQDDKIAPFAQSLKLCGGNDRLALAKRFAEPFGEEGSEVEFSVWMKGKAEKGVKLMIVGGAWKMNVNETFVPSDQWKKYALRATVTAEAAGKPYSVIIDAANCDVLIGKYYVGKPVKEENEETSDNREFGFLGKAGAMPLLWRPANWAKNSDFSKCGITEDEGMAPFAQSLKLCGGEGNSGGSGSLALTRTVSGPLGPKGSEVEFSVWMKGKAPKGVKLMIVGGGWKMNVNKTFTPDNKWKKYTVRGTVTPEAAGKPYSLVIDAANCDVLIGKYYMGQPSKAEAGK